MFKKAKCILYVAAIVVLAGGATAATIEVQLCSNKDEYICGEPVLLKTILRNPSNMDFIGNAQAYAFGSHFMIYIAVGDDDFADILSQRRPRSTWGIMTTPRHEDIFYDRQMLAKTLLAGGQTERLDMLIFPKPGEFKLKAVLKDRDGKIRSSKHIQFRILPIKEKFDSISELGQQDFLIKLGLSIFYAHHLEMFAGGSLHPEEFEKLAPVIIEKYNDSVFREYVMYADIMVHGQMDSPYHPLTSGPKDLAERFEQEYPKSWLLPEIYRRLFWTYVVEEDTEKAEEIRNKALKKAPNAVVLKRLKKKDLSRATQKPSVEHTRPILWSRPSFLIVITAVLSTVIAGLILLLRKKASSRGKSRAT